MAAIDAHPELAGHPQEPRLRALFDLFHPEPVAHGAFEAPDPPTAPCDCEWGQQYRHRNASVAIMDDHRECPFCRGRIGGENTDD